MSGCWRRLMGALGVLLVCATPALSQSLTAGADDEALWVLFPDEVSPGAFTLLHHAYSDPPELLNLVQTIRGDIRPHSVAARDHTLWIIYPHGEVQAIRAQLTVLEDSWEYHSRVEPSLPDGVSVRTTAITRTGLWALVRVEDQQTLEALSGSVVQTRLKDDQDAAKRRRNLAIGLPLNYGIDTQTEEPTADTPSDQSKRAAPSETEPTHDDAAVADTTRDGKALSLPADRLLLLERGRWRVHALPEDWAHGAQAWLLTENQSAEHPTLIARSGGSGDGRSVEMDVYRRVQQELPQWDAQSYTLDQNGEAGGLAFVGIEDQLVAAQTRFDRGELLADLSVLRGGKTMAAGQMTLPDADPSSWCLLGSGDTAILLARHSTWNNGKVDERGDLEYIWTRMDIRGHTRLEPTVLTVKMPGPMDHLTQYIMLAFIAVLVSMLMLAFWRRDASWNKLELPEGLMIADLSRRAIAAAVDMAPGLFGSMFYFGLSMEGLMQRWPGNGIAHTIEQAIPGTLVIAVFVGHTTISELFCDRTLGKLATGLRTTALDGTRPRRWQVLVRGLLKTLDLIPGAWLLLMLPVIAPHRQRLGDLVGRTVVVCEVPETDEKEKDDQKPDDG